jgi:hypothetical protein
VRLVYVLLSLNTHTTHITKEWNDVKEENEKERNRNAQEKEDWRAARRASGKATQADDISESLGRDTGAAVSRRTALLQEERGGTKKERRKKEAQETQTKWAKRFGKDKEGLKQRQSTDSSSIGSGSDRTPSLERKIKGSGSAF